MSGREGGERECVRSEWKGGERERRGVCEKARTQREGGGEQE